MTNRPSPPPTPPTVLEDAGAQSIAAWATFDAGPDNESAQSVLQYTVINIGNPGLFAVAPLGGQ